jgi:hypothetical protein
LAKLYTTICGSASQQIDPMLSLASCSVHFARRHGRLGVQEISTQILKGVFVELMEWRNLS